MSTPDEPSLRDLAAAYALGALSPEETRAFEAYLATSADARQDVAELRETAALLALSASEARPAPELRARVVDAVAATKIRPLPGVSAPRRGARLAAVGLAVRTQQLARALATRDSTIAEQSRTLTEQAKTIADQGRQLLSREATVASLLAPGVQLVQLTASGDPDPRIQLYWDRTHNTAVLRREAGPLGDVRRRAERRRAGAAGHRAVGRRGERRGRDRGAGRRLPAADDAGAARRGAAEIVRSEKGEVRSEK